MKDEQTLDFESRHPNQVDAEKFINELRKLNLENIELHDLDELIDSVFHFIPFVSANIAVNHKIFRARKNNNNEIFTNISELGIRKATDIKEFGRANTPSQATFYGSTNMKLACGEVLQNLKNTFNPRWETGLTTVSVWEVIENLQVAPVYYSEAVTKVRDDVAKYKERSKKFTREKNTIDHKTLDVSDMIMEFFCDEFSKPIRSNHEYKFSASYANRLKNMNNLIAPQFQHNRFHGLLYPSCAMKFEGDNIALFDENLDSKLKFITAYQVLCTDFDFEKMNFKIYIMHEIESIDNDGNLKWNNEVWRPK